ncbi:hypothetical protein P7K49_021179 [Saguinus oedipus]|uniref:Uncharacterized protein n=1 Tax=Saguinus oedipus TaxID=9490 RepID=A0ABQ9USP7_SAGOE|nr:hypothetical protein P7K49_021179 [Saguinus oedipus]
MGLAVHRPHHAPASCLSDNFVPATLAPAVKLCSGHSRRGNLFPTALHSNSHSFITSALHGDFLLCPALGSLRLSPTREPFCASWLSTQVRKPKVGALTHGTSCFPSKGREASTPGRAARTPGAPAARLSSRSRARQRSLGTLTRLLRLRTDFCPGSQRSAQP